MTRSLAAAAAALCGSVALAARPVAREAVLVTASVGVIGLRPSWRPAMTFASMRRWAGATAVGVLAVAIASAAGSTPPSVVAPIAVAASVVAAIAEEAFFRGFLYRWLQGWGPALAIGASALAFAAVHVPMYGWRAAPVNLAAGLLFGWQRWVTGTWSAPAAAHGMANLLSVTWA